MLFCVLYYYLTLNCTYILFVQYQDLVAMEKFLNKLESQIHEIEQCNQDTQPGDYRSDRASSMTENVDELQSELVSLNNGIKTILERIGYQLPSMMDQSDMTQNKITQCVEYSRFLNEIISKYQDDLAKELLGDDDEEMDIKELEEKRRKLQEQTKRSSRKVSKTYIALQKGGKQKYIPSRSGHRRSNNSREFMSDDTSNFSGVSEAEKELEVIFVFLLFQSEYHQYSYIHNACMHIYTGNQ